ncbi:SGT1 protein-domain-containing protein [Obelidium mucronatum]|nr:SGT1 protein-domain-containing protein [Obelidium mucronatum]
MPARAKRTKLSPPGGAAGVSFGAPLTAEQQRRTQPDDCVWYRFYPDATATRAAPDLAALLALVSACAARLTSGHIWHSEKFGLALSDAGNGGVESPFFYGKTRFGDCIDDEWLIVFLVREISRQFSEFGLVASIWDNDGAFLLIEAADHLPNWLTPTTANNRIFLCNGDLHIIPPPKSPAQQAYLPSTPNIPLERALHIVRTHPDITLASPEIQTAAFSRCIEFPAKLKVDGYHYVTCVVPRNVARCLKGDEGLVAPAVDAFYLRDPMQLKACQTMSKFHPSTNITTTIRFTRTLYAQIASQEFHSVPPVYSHILPDKKSPEYKAFDIGMKLAVGFEILSIQDKSNTFATGAGGSARRSVDTYSFDSDPEWRLFFSRLMKLGYFKTELPGSKLYKVLLREAQQQHLNRLFPASGASMQEDGGDGDEDLEDGTTALAGLQEPALTRIQRALFNVPENTPDSEIIDTRKEDSDDWLFIDPDVLEDMLKSFGGGNELREEDLSTDDELEDDEEEDLDAAKKERKALKKGVRNLENVVKRFGAFVDQKSSVDGVVFPGEEDMEEPNQNDDDFLEAGDSDDDSDESSDNDEALELGDPNAMDIGDDDLDNDQDIDKPLEIDDDKFMKAMIKILGIDESILKTPATTTTTTSKTASAAAPLTKKQKHSAPKALPASFDPSSLLLRPTPTSHTPLVTLDDSDDDTQDLTGVKGVGIIGNRRGVQESEDDSDDEKEVVGKWDQVFLKGLEAVERQLEESRARMKNGDDGGNSIPAPAAINQDMEEDNDASDEDDDDDKDLKLDEYMAAMDLELSRSKIGRSGPNKKGMFGDADVEIDDIPVVNKKEQRPKWRLKRMEENGVRIQDSDDESSSEESENGRDNDVDVNLVQNLLESYQAQNGLPGPASNILGRLGLQLPRDASSK